jgi:hypothetical protein
LVGWAEELHTSHSPVSYEEEEEDGAVDHICIEPVDVDVADST